MNESNFALLQVVRASTNDHLVTSRQIEKDLLRTLPGHVCFNSNKATGVPRLRRVLRGLAWLYPDIGYCQVINTKPLLYLEHSTLTFRITFEAQILVKPVK